MRVLDKHIGVGGLNDTYIGLGFGKENHSPDPTPPHQAFFFPGVNKKLII